MSINNGACAGKQKDTSLHSIDGYARTNILVRSPVKDFSEQEDLAIRVEIIDPEKVHRAIVLEALNFLGYSAVC